MSYTSFLKSHSREGVKLRRLYWVHGSEQMLRLLTVRRIRELSPAAGYDTRRLSLADTSEAEVWSLLDQASLDADRASLTLIYESHRMEGLDRLTTLITQSPTNATFVFVSGSPDFEAPEGLTRSTQSQIVRCTLPKDPESRAKRAQEIVQGWDPRIDRGNSALLVAYVGYDMTEAWNVVAKFAYFPRAQINRTTIEAFAERRAEHDLVMRLLNLQKRETVEALQAGPVNARSIIGTLSTHLDMLSRIQPLLTQRLTVREMAVRCGTHEAYVRMLLPAAKFYPAREAVRRTLLLQRLDADLARGAGIGLVESLVAMW